MAVDVINAKTLTSSSYLACLKSKWNYTYSEDIVFNWIFSFGEALVGSGASASVKKLYENKDIPYIPISQMRKELIITIIITLLFVSGIVQYLFVNKNETSLILIILLGAFVSGVNRLVSLKIAKEFKDENKMNEEGYLYNSDD